MQHPPQYLLLDFVHLLIASIFVTFTVCCNIILTLTVYILRKNFFPEKRLLVRIESKVSTCLVYQKGKAPEAQPRFNLK